MPRLTLSYSTQALINSKRVSGYLTRTRLEMKQRGVKKGGPKGFMFQLLADLMSNKVWCTVNECCTFTFYFAP